MLKRRNTVHPVQHPVHLMQRQPAPSATKSIITNPFLSSSCEDLKKKTPVHLAEGSYDHYAIKQKHIHTRTSSNATATSNTTNPFLYEPTTFTTNLMVDAGHPDQCEDHTDEDYQDEGDFVSNRRGSQKYKTHSRPGGSRRLSLDLFKTPFGWHRRRRATCASPDMKRTPIINQSLDRTEEILRSSFTNLIQPSEDALSKTDDDMILKSSRYHPEEDEVRDNQYKHDEEQAHRDSNPELAPFTGAYPAEPSEDYALGRQDDESSTKFPERRRHSVFSDWSIEDCPRLLAFQKKQQSKNSKGGRSKKASSSR
ncbi:hypothetical protein BGX26_006191 [Mortierella sp. AD094]|nr:hypothetical protein BGX26_006191 [Mortierella sp. AD094]